MSAEAQPLTRPALELPSSTELLASLLDVRGSTGDTYRRLYNYSARNIGFLALQGCPPSPVATYKRWQELGFHVKKGEKAYSILRPIQVKVETPDEEEQRFIRRFKVVRALFHYGQVAGEGQMPPYEPRVWSLDWAMKTLDIKQEPFASYNGNVQGYSYERQIAINPIAVYPLKTAIHEMAHIVLGHTTETGLKDYAEHRGIAEFEAEGTAYLTMKELDADEAWNPAESRGYVQSWTRGADVTEKAAGHVLTGTTTILNAGYEEGADDAR